VESGSPAQNTSRNRVWLLLLIVYFSSLTVVTVAYRDTTITFLRAESGWYELVAHSDDATQQNMKRLFWKRSYHGHYTPIAFWLEFEQTKIAGPHASYWRLRAPLIAALVATAIFCLVRAAAAHSGLNAVAQSCVGGGTAMLFIFQPLMREMIAWPFLILQMMWIILTTFALRALVGVVSEAAAKRWIWISAIAAYASLHTSGLGLASAAATLGTLLLFLFLTFQSESGVFDSLRLHRRSLIAASSALALMTLIHACCMWLLVPSVSPAASGALPISLNRALLAFFALYPFFLAHSLFLFPFAPYNIAVLLQDSWPFGLSFAAVLIFAVLIFARVARRNSEFTATRLLLFGFSALFYVVFVAMVGMQEWSSASSGDPLFGYFVGARYMVPASVILIVAVLALLMPALRRHQRLAAVTALGLAACALIGQRQFARNSYAQQQPDATISHDRAWSLVCAMTVQSRGAGLAVPNVPLGHLTHEFYDWDTKLFEPLLRSELHLPPQERINFTDMQDALSVRGADYESKVPAFAQLREILKLNDAAAH